MSSLTKRVEALRSSLAGSRQEAQDKGAKLGLCKPSELKPIEKSREEIFYNLKNAAGIETQSSTKREREEIGINHFPEPEARKLKLKNVTTDEKNYTNIPISFAKQPAISMQLHN